MLMLNTAIVASIKAQCSIYATFCKIKTNNISTKNNLISGYKVPSERLNTENLFLLMSFLAWA